ncbi:MAG: ABC transporter ATP-binding protein/permease [Ignavibacteria bacterium]|nr:ABC transporter ATP-binding protein/permease [Ignavibacteria bacterium]
MVKRKYKKFQEEEVLGKQVDYILLRRLLSFAKPYIFFIILATVLTILISALSAIRPRLTPIAIDDKVAKGDIPGLNIIIVILLGTLIIQALIQYFNAYLTSWIGQKIVYDLRKKLYSHIIHLNLKYFDNTPIGRIVTRVTNDIDVLYEVFSSGLVTALGDIFTIVWILYFMFSLDTTLALITMSVLPLLVYATAVFRKKARDSYRKIRILVAKMNAYIQEHITGISVVQLFVKEKDTIEEFSKINRAHTEQNKRGIRYYAVFFPVVEFIGAMSVALVIWYGGGQVVQNNISVGVLISFIQFIEMFFRPIRDLAEKYNILQTAMASSERIFELLDTKSDIIDPKHPVKYESIKGEIEFKNVSFAYNEEEYVLKNVSFKINAGERVAFVGATGAGKSTIINLLCRFYDVNQGEITLDGINIKNLKQEDLRKNIAVVLQDVFLFSGDIRYNINLGNDKITNEKIHEAISNVGLKKFINSLPDNIYHRVSERGATLSTGQKQLISFARALAYSPKILILDEATSSVDTETELLIQEAIKKLIEDRTSIIIAHRLSTIQCCDKIIVLHKGQIREIGTHQELLEKGGLYYKLYQLQYKNQI